MVDWLRAQPLTAEAFAPFGDVIETEGKASFPINEGTTQRFHKLATIEALGPEAMPALSIFRASQRQFPLDIGFVEKHPLGSQAFVPLARQRFLVLVAPPGKEPTPESLRLFISNGRQGVNYHRDVWHFPLLALEPDSDFLVADRTGGGHDFLVADRIGGGHNCDLFHFPANRRIVIPTDWEKPDSRAGSAIDPA